MIAQPVPGGNGTRGPDEGRNGITTAQAATVLGVCATKVRRLIRSGELRAYATSRDARRPVYRTTEQWCRDYQARARVQVGGYR